RLVSGVASGPRNEEFLARNGVPGRCHHGLPLGFGEHRELTGRAQDDVPPEVRLIPALEIAPEPIRRDDITPVGSRHGQEDAFEVTHGASFARVPEPGEAAGSRPGLQPATRSEPCTANTR